MFEVLKNTHFVSTATGQTICSFHWPNFYESIIWTSNNISSWPIKYSCSIKQTQLNDIIKLPTSKNTEKSKKNSNGNNTHSKTHAAWIYLILERYSNWVNIEYPTYLKVGGSFSCRVNSGHLCSSYACVTSCLISLIGYLA